jgi:hypothetical protein
MSPRQRVGFWAAGIVLLAWILAWTGHRWARESRMTADKVRAYVGATDLRALTAEARRKALRGLADRLNALSFDERRRARLEQAWRGWIDQMTEEELAGLIEATLPGGVQQMLKAFEQTPPERRQRMVDEALKRLQQGAARGGGDGPQGVGPPIWAVSDEQRQRLVSLGLGAYYSQSSAQTKAELAPVLEELQNVMRGTRGMPHR